MMKYLKFWPITAIVIYSAIFGILLLLNSKLNSPMVAFFGAFWAGFPMLLLTKFVGFSSARWWMIIAIQYLFFVGLWLIVMNRKRMVLVIAVFVWFVINVSSFYIMTMWLLKK